MSIIGALFGGAPEAPAPDGSKPKWTRGRAVVDGELQYVSPSQIVKADHQSFGGCLRRWHYGKVMGLKEPEFQAAATGTEGHAQIAEYMTTGRMVLGQHALKAKRFLPEPSRDHQVELSIDDGSLLIAGLPMVGLIDWLNPSRTVQLDHGEVYDPARSEEIVDWKFTGRKEFPSPREVAESPPMTIYGEWRARKAGLEYVRLSHVYIATRRREVSKRSVLVRRQDLIPRYQRAEGVVRLMQQAARCKSAEEVDANLEACSAGQGCPFRSQCSAGTQKSLIDLLGPQGAADFLRPKEDPMSLLSIPALAAMQKQPTPAEVEAERARLAAEEAAARKEQVPPGISQAIEYIHSVRGVQVRLANGTSTPLGAPALGGDAATLWATFLGLDFQGHGLSGSGALAGTTVMNAADLPALAQEISAVVAAQPAPAVAPAAPPAVGLLPPDAPVSNPAAMQQTAAAAPPPVVPQTVNVVNVAAPPPSAGAPIAAFPPPPPAAPVAEEPGELKLSKKARAEFERLQARLTEVEGQLSVANQMLADARSMPAVGPAPTAAPAAGLQVYADAIPPTAPFTDLGPWVREVVQKLAERCQVADVRLAPKGSPLEFGQWRAHLAACFREVPLADGVYFLDTRGSDFAEIAADAMRTRAGAQVTRGIR